MFSAFQYFLPPRHEDTKFHKGLRWFKCSNAVGSLESIKSIRFVTGYDDILFYEGTLYPCHADISALFIQFYREIFFAQRNDLTQRRNDRKGFFCRKMKSQDSFRPPLVQVFQHSWAT